LLFGLPKGIGEGLVTASLRERIAVVRQPSALFALCVSRDAQLASDRYASDAGIPLVARAEAKSN